MLYISCAGIPARQANFSFHSSKDNGVYLTIEVKKIIQLINDSTNFSTRRFFAERQAVKEWLPKVTTEQ